MHISLLAKQRCNGIGGRLWKQRDMYERFCIMITIPTCVALMPTTNAILQPQFLLIDTCSSLVVVV